MEHFSMDANSVWGMLIFTALVSAAIGAAAHKWLFARAKEVEVAVDKLTNAAAAKVNEIRKDGL